MNERLFRFSLIGIIIIGFLLRMYQYDRVPGYNETFDEVHYAWGGGTWLTTGVPKTWSNFDPSQLSQQLEKWGVSWRLVWPAIGKPPLYYWLSGLTVLLFHRGSIFDVPHAIIRILPLILSVFSIFLTGLFAAKLFSRPVGLLAALLYATVPTIVLANRLSLTENLLTPLALLAGIVVMGMGKRGDKGNRGNRGPVMLGVISALSILTKQSGIAVGVGLLAFLIARKQWKAAGIVSLFSLCGLLIYAAIGYAYDWKLFLALQASWRNGHALSGLPEFIFSLFRYPTISSMNHIFLDGAMLTGYILLFSSPLWLRQYLSGQKSAAFLSFPITYLTLVTLSDSAGSQFTFFGWYLYPLFPYLMILLAALMRGLWEHFSLLPLLMLTLILGSSTTRFLFLILPKAIQHRWQYALLTIFLVLLLTAIQGGKRVKRVIVLTLFLLFTLVNCIATLAF